MAARSISELITTEGRINLDFNDVNTTLRDGGVAVISTGYGEGDLRITKSIEDALNSPLLKNRDVYSAKNILVNIYYSRNANEPFKMAELNDMSRFMTNFSPEVDVIWGVGYDDTLGEKVKTTILAAGFDVTLDAEAPVGKVAGKNVVKQDDDELQRLAGEYGGKVAQTNIERAENKVFVFLPEDLDNDEIIDLFEKTPTFNRDREPKFKSLIAELRKTVSAPKDPAAAPANAAKKSTGTITF